jgi:FkbM family methyltransferase
MSSQPPDATATINLDQGVFRFRACRHGPMAFLRCDDTIGRSPDQYGEFAKSENHLMTALVRPGDTVLDVGANVGTVTLPLARQVGPAGHVFAFEPQRLILQALCATLTLNGLTNVRAIHAAVGRESGTLRVPALDATRPGNYGAFAVKPGETVGEKVPLTTLDSLELTHCDLVKIDVEGQDYEVLLGAEQTVARCRPHVYMEAKKGPGTPAAIAWLLARDYRCYWHFAAFFSPDNYRGVAENVFGPRGDINLLAMPVEKGQASLPIIRGPDADWEVDYRDMMHGSTGTSIPSSVRSSGLLPSP